MSSRRTLGFASGKLYTSSLHVVWRIGNDPTAPFLPLEDPAAKTLTATLFSDGDTFYTHVISQSGGSSPQTLVATLFADADSFYGGVITGGTVSVNRSTLSLLNIESLNSGDSVGTERLEGIYVGKGAV